ncbi:MAG: hypothetical protein AAFU80_15225 [Pseudomonadota bacterium]
MRYYVLPLILLGTSGYAQADVPQVPTNPPYIVLSDNLDEPNGYGFCIDTTSRGLTDLAQTHTCKPADASRARDDRDNDTRFFYDPDTGQIASFAFDGVCLQALRAGQVTVFALLECNGHPRQTFVYDAVSSTVKMATETDMCITVSEETIPAGPWVKRDLVLQSCEDVDASLKQWSIVTE